MEKLLTITEMANVLNVPKSWFYTRTRLKGKSSLPMIRVGKYIRFEKDKVMEWVKKGNAHGISSND